MDFLSVILLVFMVLLVIQWMHPLHLMLFYRIEQPIKNQVIFYTGMLCFFGFLVSLYLVTTNKVSSHTVNLLIGALIVLGMGINTFSTFLAINKIDNDNMLDVTEGLLMTYSGSLGYYLIYGFQRFLSSEDREYFWYLRFDGKNDIFITAIYNFFIFSVVSVIAYTFFIYASTIKKSLKNNVDTMTVITTIKKRLSFRNYSLAALVGVFLAFFYFSYVHFADDVSTDYVERFNSTIQVFQLLASSMLIPLIFSIFQEKQGNHCE